MVYEISFDWFVDWNFVFVVWYVVFEEKFVIMGVEFRIIILYVVDI